MPAQLEYLDQDVSVTPPTGYLQALPFTLGPSWQQNDLRVLFVSGSESGASGTSEAIQLNPDPPTGFTAGWVLAQDFETRGTYCRRLLNSDADGSVAWIKPTGWRDFVFAPLTIRGVDPGSTPVAGDLTQSMTHKVQDKFITVSSIAVPAAGELVLCLWTVPDPEGNWPSWATALGVPTGWTFVSSTDKSGETFNPDNEDNDPAVLIVANAYASAGTTGAITVPCNRGSHAFAGMYLFVKAAPDVPATIGAVSETDTAGPITATVLTRVSASISAVTETDTAGQIFTGTSGFGLSPVLQLSGLRVTGSVVEWTETTGLPLLVETTINGAASWDVATNGEPVPRLAPGDTDTLSVQMRVSAARASATDPSPNLTYMRLAVTDDASTVEMVPVGHGVVDKVTRKRTSSNSASGSTGGPGTTGKGGGAAGGGRSLKVHAVDLSKLVSANPWGSAFVVQKDENYVDAAVRMLLNRLPTQKKFKVCATTRTTPEPFVYGLTQGTDAWKDIREFLAPASLECFFDAEGAYVIRQIPDPSVGVPVWTIGDDAHPVITDLTEELSADEVFNSVTVKGEGTSTKNAVSATAVDDNPLSDTYILGDFGTHSVTITLPGLETNDQAQVAANAILAGSLAGSQVITISMVPNPALEAGDLVRLDLEDDSMSGVYLVTGMTWSPSQADSMQLICSRQASKN